MERTGLSPFPKLPGVSVDRQLWGFSQVPENERDDFMQWCNAKGKALVVVYAYTQIRSSEYMKVFLELSDAVLERTPYATFTTLLKYVM